MSPSPPKTRILIISDTHGLVPRQWRPAKKDDDSYGVTLLSAFTHPLPEADVAIHCGDLTMSNPLNSSLKEYKATLSFLRAIPAPLKIAIPGNHDTALDDGWWRGHNRHWRDTRPPVNARALLSSVSDEGVHLLVEEGRYDFVLANGARLRLYASPCTPLWGSWAFQYDRDEGHDFAIETGMDIAITHGPPRGILDRTKHHQNVGCDCLLASLKKARPRVHCFGHIHEGWGAQLVKWDVEDKEADAEAVAINEEESRVIENLDTMEGTRTDSKETRAKKLTNRNRWVKEHGARLVDATALRPGEETLAVNAAVVSLNYKPIQLPWLVDLDLPQATEEDRRRAEDTASLLREYRQQAALDSVVAPARS